MHSQVIGFAELIIIFVIGGTCVAFAIFVLASLVKRFGALRILGWGVGFFLAGLLGISLLFVLLGVQQVQMHEDAFVTMVRTSPARSRAVVMPKRFRDEVAVNSSTTPQFLMEEPNTSAWDENIAPVANIYPSIPDCGRPLAAKLASHLREELNSKEESSKAEADVPAGYRVALKNGGLEQPEFLNFLINFRKDFTAAFPGSFVDDMTAGPYPSPKDPDMEKQLQRLHVTVYRTSDGQGRFFKLSDQKSSKTIEPSGQIVCKLRRNGPMGQMEFTSDFIDKPWVADPEKFVSSRPKQKFIIGFSHRLAKSEQEACASALKDANVRLAKSANKIFQPNYDMEKNVVDRFVQKLTMPYGSVWREAVLIDYSKPDTRFRQVVGDALVNEGHVAPVPDQVTNSIFRPSTERLVAGLMMLTIIVGWVSNWMTQGYYRKPVWTVAGTLFTVGFLVLLVIVLLTVA